LTARKKSTKSATTQSTVQQEVDRSSPEVLKGPVIRDGTLYLSPYDLTRLELVQQRCLNWRQGLELVRLKQRDLQTRYEAELLGLRTEEGRLALRATSADTEAEKLKAELGELYSINFSEATYKPATGQLIVHDNPILIGVPSAHKTRVV
jgi:hypothetical protein